MNRGLGLPPLGLYIHLPWCIRKCPYCDFNSHEASGETDQMGYIDALLADLDFELAWLPDDDRMLRTIFIGGGTPSLFAAEAIDRLLSGVADRMPCSADMEVTLEANPGAFERDRFTGYRQAGVSRLSLGIQSFNADSLTRLGRIHGPEEALAAIEAARSAGFEHLNLDLMCGLPAQTLAMAMEDVETAIATGPDHISYYQLTLEPNTPFYQRPPLALPDHDLAFEIQMAGRQLLQGANYEQYEVSAYARIGGQCRHNLNYWEFGDYLGIGAGAHGKLSNPRSGEVVRRWRVKSPRQYQKAAGSDGALSGSRCLDATDLFAEFMINALRLRGGFNEGLFVQRTGLPSASLWDRLQDPEARQLLELRGDSVRASEQGWLFLDELLSTFI